MGSRHRHSARRATTAAPARHGWLAVFAALAGWWCHPAETPPGIVFQDLASASGIQGDPGLCLAAADFDGDGSDDLLTTMKQQDGSFLLTAWRNDGSGRFDGISFGHPTEFRARCTVGDLDRDGRPDVVLASGETLSLLHNDGNFSFSRLPLTVDFLPPAAVWVLGAFDANADGQLDLYFAFDPAVEDFTCGPSALTAERCKPTTPPNLYVPALLVRKDNAFRPLPDSGRIKGWVNGVQFMDIDGDGLTDLFETVEFEPPNRFYRNRGDGSFEDLIQSSRKNPTALLHGMGAAFADFAGAGRWDTYIALIGSDQLWFGMPFGENGATQVGVADATQWHVGWSPLGVDFDNDADPDVFIANSAQAPDEKSFDQLLEHKLATLGPLAKVQADYVLENRISETGRMEVSQVPNPTLVPSIAATYASALDFDGDGREDVAVVTRSYGFAVFRLLHNESAAGGRHWVDVELHGTKSNREALGATVRLEADGREIGRGVVGSVGLAPSVRRLHFGLGQRTKVDRIRITWPGGGTQDEPGPAAVDRRIVIEEK